MPRVQQDKNQTNQQPPCLNKTCSNEAFLSHRQIFAVNGVILRRPQNASIYRRKIIVEMDNIGLESLGIVAIISVFMGAVVTIQTAFNTDHPLLPIYAIGFATRQSIILEFSPTIISLILAGKIGSRIASEIGTMRVTEQIDALEVMGINAAGYLILPKIIASMVVNPMLVIISIFLGILEDGSHPTSRM